MLPFLDHCFLSEYQWLLSHTWGIKYSTEHRDDGVCYVHCTSGGETEIQTRRTTYVALSVVCHKDRTFVDLHQQFSVN